MANAEKGEASFEFEGKSYTFVLSINALCELEDLLGQRINDTLAKLGNPNASDLRTMRAMLWAGLREHHPDVTLKQAGVMLQKMGLAGITALLNKGIERTFPRADADRPLEDAPAIGNGKPS
jgi:hypothetical protein